MYAKIQKQLQKRTLFLFILFVCHLSDVLASLATTHLMVTHVGPCEHGPKGLLTVDELSITTQTYDSSITGVFNITEDVDDGWFVTGTMQKCQDIRNIDTCDHFATFHVVSDGCRDDEAEEIYSMFFHYVTPDLECPIRAGNYKLTNYPLFSEHNYLTVSEAKISTSVFGYTFQLDGFTVNNKRFFCIEAYLQLMYVREHDWLGGQQTDKPSRTTATTAAPKADIDDEDDATAAPKADIDDEDDVTAAPKADIDDEDDATAAPKADIDDEDDATAAPKTNDDDDDEDE